MIMKFIKTNNNMKEFMKVGVVSLPQHPPPQSHTILDKDSASKNTDSSVFYTEIETKILNTDSDPQNIDRDPIIRVIAIQQITVTLR